MAVEPPGCTELRIAELTARLAELDQERQTVLAKLEDLRQLQAAEPVTVPVPVSEPSVSPLTAGREASVTMASATDDKIALFGRLFRGRRDVFPKRWDNPKTGKSGYQG